MQIEASSMGIDLPGPKSPTYNDTLDMISKFTAAYNKLTDNIDKNGINGTSPLTAQMSPVAVNIIDTSERIQQLASFSKSIMEQRLTQNAITMKDTLLAIGQLDAQQQFLENKYPSGIYRHQYYYKWLEKYDGFKKNTLVGKLQESEDFKRQKVEQLIASKPGDIPTPLTVEDHAVIDGLLGKGYVDAPVILMDKTYKDMFWNDGYVLDGKPFLQGSLYCVKDRSPVGTQNTTFFLAEIIPTDACSNPTEPPSPEPQCISGSPQCPSDGVCCDENDFRTGSTCFKNVGTNGSGCCNKVSWCGTVCMKCNPDLTNCAPYNA
jgi:hypothetical protein